MSGQEQQRLLRSKEAAIYLGISERKLWTLGRGGEIPRVCFGRTVRYDRVDLDAWIEKSKRRRGRGLAGGRK